LHCLLFNPEFAQFKFSGLHHDIEDYLSLRPLKEESVKKEQDARTSEHCSRMPIPVQIDWDSVINAKDRGYVAEVRRIGELARYIIVNTGSSDFGNHSAVGIANEPHCLRALKNYSCLVITFLSVNINFNPGDTKKLQPRDFKVGSKGDKLILECYRHQATGSSHYGPGLTIEWSICPSEAATRERNEVKRLASIYRNNEIDYRNNQIARYNDDVKRAQKDYADDVKKWQRECNSVTAHNNEACHWCHGKGIVSCGNSCGGSKCRTCGGSKKKACTWSHCPLHYSEQKMPREPKEPRIKDPPSFRDLGGMVDGYISEI